MMESSYNKAKNTSKKYTHFELNYKYYLFIFYKENVDPCSRSKAANELIQELRNLVAICRKNL